VYWGTQFSLRQTKKQLQRAPDRFAAYYNEVRPHRELGRRTPMSL
jgi:transposase InsO family protein